MLLATVKGDVHDIGKNIVGVILSCNNYEVIDLGVMVPAEAILDAAVREKADFIGLSGLITPSLEEMVHVASLMEARGMQIPLLIGGATTSEIHTAVKIAPVYSFSTVHVKDASRAVPVLSGLMSPTSTVAAGVKEKYGRLREEHEAARKEKRIVTLEAARRNGMRSVVAARAPAVKGVVNYGSVAAGALTDLIDWTFFFFAWRMNGRYPEIFDDPVRGPEARKLYEDAVALCRRIEEEELFVIKALSGIWNAVREGDDIRILPGEGREEKWFRFLRNQEEKEPGKKNLCLADFVTDDGNDHAGAFVVTVNIRETLPSDIADDDYRRIMLHILADRYAEAAAEWLHREVRIRQWGYAPGEDLSPADLFKGRYRGIRPAPGYPACPDHRGKQEIFDLLDATETIGVTLTGSFAMVPVSAVCAWLFASPEASYFNVGTIGCDQLDDYARRCGVSTEEAERWLAPNL